MAAVLMCACNATGDDIELALTDAAQAERVCTCDYQTVWISFVCNRSWVAKTSADWVELDPTRGSKGEDLSIAAVVSQNKGSEYRVAEITIEAGDRILVITLSQEPVIQYVLQENFNRPGLILEEDLPSGWYSLDDDNDGNGWRCYKDPETEETFAYSASYVEFSGTALHPDNWMVTPRFVLRNKGFKIKWDSKSDDPEYPGDKYQVWVAGYEDGGELQLYQKICEEETTESTELTHHEVSLDLYTDITICIAFRHYDSVGKSRVLITNVEVSNK